MVPECGQQGLRAWVPWGQPVLGILGMVALPEREGNMRRGYAFILNRPPKACPWGRGVKGRPYGEVEVAKIRGPSRERWGLAWTLSLMDSLEVSALSIGIILRH